MTPCCVLSQLANQPVFRVQSVDADSDEGICILNRNMLFPIQVAITTNDCNVALMKANLLMNLYFED